MWRGLTLTNKPVLQPATYLSIPVGNASVTLGAWSNMDLGALARFNAGRAISDDPQSDEISNYQDDGFTHLDLSAGVPFALGAISITPVVHFLVNGDDRTKTTAPTDLNEDVKLWGGVSLSWSNTLGPDSPPDDGS